MDSVQPQTICSGTAFETPFYSSDVLGSSYFWTLVSQDVPSEVSGYPQSSTYPVQGELNGVVIDNDLTTEYTLEYALTVSYEGCQGSSVPFFITVNPSPVVSITPPGSQSLCLNGVFETLNVSYDYPDTISNTTYQWYYNSTDTTDISAATAVGTDDSQFTPPSDELGTKYYFCVLSFNPSICEDVSSPTVTISVENPPSISSNPLPSQNICLGGNIEPNSLSVSYNGGSGSPTYTWYAGYSYLIPFEVYEVNSPVFDPGVGYFDNISIDLNDGYEEIFFWSTISFPDGGGCGGIFSDPGKVTVFSDPVLSDPLATQTICQDSPSSALTVLASGGTGTYSYQWYDVNGEISGETTDTFTPPTTLVGTFNYYCIVTTDASGCETTSTTAEVIVSPGPSVTSNPLATQTVCLDGATTDLEVLYADGVGTPTYQWYQSSTCDTSDLSSPILGAESSTYTPLSDTVGVVNYFVVLTFSEGGCGSITSECALVEVVPDPTITITSSLPGAICEGGEINDIVATATDGIGNATYTWYKDGVQEVQGLDLTTYNPGLFDIAGTYEFYVEVSFDGSGCDPAASEIVQVTVFSDPVLSDPLATQTICQDSPSSALTVLASGGTGTYSYQWYDVNGEISGETTDTFTPPTTLVGTFNYYCIVTTDASGCETTSTTAEVIVSPSPTINSQPLSTQTVCEFGTVITLELSYIDGVGTPTYQWYVSDTNDITDLSSPIIGATSSSYSPSTTPPGTLYYFAVLTFAEGGCGVITSEISEVEIKPVAIIPDVSVEICDLTSYTLNPEDGSIPNSSTILPNETTYTWTFIDNVNIDGESSVFESDFPQGVGAPNQFDSGLLNNNTFTNLETVVFEVTPWTNGCSGPSFDVAITVSPEPEINAVVTNIDCSYSEPLCAGNIEINPTGMAPFTYNWTSQTPGVNIISPTERDQFDLCPGIYELIITDDSGCSYNYEYEIIPPEPVNFNLVASTNVSCNNIDQLPCDGSIELETSGGTLPYSLIEWYRDDSDPSDIEPDFQLYSSNTLELVNLCAGDYLLKVLDANGCEFLSPVYTIEQGFIPVVISETFSNYNGFNIDCFGANSGIISLDISGGSGIFAYTFSNGNPIEDITGNIDLQGDPLFTLDFEFLTSGDYEFTLSDFNCPTEIIRNYSLNQPEDLVITATLVDPIECFGGLATYDVTANGGVPPYTGTGLQSVLSGIEIFTVTDANGCLDDFSTVVGEPEELLATYITNDAPCFGDTGEIIITPTAGTGVLTINLYDEDVILISSLNTTQGSSVTFNQFTGTYFYEVIDENNCQYGPEVVVINEPEPINIVDFEVNQPDCNTLPAWEFNNGSICITITGGTNPFPTGTVGWVNNGGGQWCLNDLSAGSYSIDVTDINSCTLQNPIPDIILFRPPAISAVLTNTLDINCDTDTATQINTIIVNGGVPPYQVTWSGGIVDAANPFVMQTSEAGNYSAFVNDQYGISNGCPPIEFPLDPITFFEFGVSDFTLNSANSDFCDVFAVSDPVNFNNISTGDINNTEWNFGDGSPTVSNIDSPSHVYDVIGSYTVSLTVEDVYGCFDTYNETINVTRGYEIILPNAFTPNGDGINETIRPVYNCMTEVQMSIYDTWGSLVYAEVAEAEDIYGWDGTIDGNPAENGNYIMVVKAVALNGTVVDLNGPVTLIK